MARREFKSPYDGSVLTFEVTTRNEYGVDFDVGVRTPRFSGFASSSTFHVGSPAELFREMASEWTGWKGEKSWSDLERSVEIVATSDRIGHICLRITLSGQGGDEQLQVRLIFESGQLQTMSDEIASYLP